MKSRWSQGWPDRLPDYSVPLQRPALPEIHIAHRQDEHEHEHLDDQKSGHGPELVEGHRPRDHEHGLDVEDDKEHGHEIELDGETLPRITQHRHSRLIWCDLG